MSDLIVELFVEGKVRGRVGLGERVKMWKSKELVILVIMIYREILGDKNLEVFVYRW